MAVADSSNGNGGTATGSNPSLSDTNGFGVTNHMKGDINSDSYNGTNNGIGWDRSAKTGAQVSAQSGRNRVVVADPHTLDYQVEDIQITTGTVAKGQEKRLQP